VGGTAGFDESAAPPSRRCAATGQPGLRGGLLEEDERRRAFDTESQLCKTLTSVSRRSSSERRGGWRQGEHCWLAVRLTRAFGVRAQGGVMGEVSWEGVAEVSWEGVAVH
jgi:hypothetical protein